MIKNQYTKTDGERNLLSKRQIIADVPVVTAVEIVSTIPEGYSKPVGTKEIPAYIVIFSGGEVRERDYFNVITKNKTRFPRIRLEFLCRSDVLIKHDDPKKTILPNEGGFSPDKLYLFAKHWIDERYTDSDMLIDSVYLLSDVDHFISELKRIEPLCRQQRMKLIMSNSCFEKWLYYGHFAEKPHERSENPFSCPDSVLEISSEFKAYCDTIISGGLDPRKSIYNIETAIVNSEANYSIDCCGIPKLYSTNMFVLGQELLPLIKPELEAIQRDAKKREEFFRSTTIKPV